jgi:hypothetical protein
MSARDDITAHFTSAELAEELVDAHRIQVLTEDGQAYDGELAMLRGLVATLRAVAKHGDLTDIQKLLDEHERDEHDAYTEAGEKSSRKDGAS